MVSCLFAVLNRCVPDAIVDLLDEVGSLKDNVKKMNNTSNLVDKNNQTISKDLTDSFR